MKPLKILFVGLLLSLAIQAPGFAQGPSAKGFDSLLCLANVLSPEPVELKEAGQVLPLPGGQVKIVALTDVSCAVAFGVTLCQIQVQIFHGKSDSIHTLTFQDNDQPPSLSLTCGDTVLNVASP